MPEIQTLHHLLGQHRKSASATALLAPDRQPITYHHLLQQLDHLAARLVNLGIGHNDPVAIVLPNGPEMVVTFLAITSLATAAPLNPAHRAAEFAYYLNDLQAKALLLPAGIDSPARQAAADHRIPIIELTATGGDTFTLTGDPLPPPASGAAVADDIAVLLHTSGATARPKLVPITHRNLYHSALSTVRALQLTPADRCLNIMPQFHIHGLLAGTIASLVAGGSVVCPPAFSAPQFFQWLADFQPTWYTAVPSMHQTILARAAYESDVPARLRFIRSSSSPLPSAVMTGLELLFHAPVIEVYGMTEACSQVAANPLSPGRRKPGSVGPAAGPEIAIMAPHSPTRLPPGQTGEIVLRGPNITAGYLRNPAANEKGFTDGWFRTGDLGHLDEDNYLFISGRIKELIDRSGEKISPFEIDQALLRHPAVTQAVAFGVPHPILGEEVAAAVVLHAPTGEAELRRFVSTQLADFKTPRRILILDALPLSSTGKVPRVDLAAQLGLTAESFTDQQSGELLPPSKETEQTVARLWQQALNVPEVSANQHFQDLGGDSIPAAQIVAGIQDLFQVELSLMDFFDAPTVSAQAALLESRQLESGPADDLLQFAAGQERFAAAPASFSQEHLWFLQQLDPGSPAYNIARAYRFTGLLNLPAFEDSLAALRLRHDSLCTTFRPQDGSLVQVITPPTGSQLVVTDLRRLPPSGRGAAVSRLAAEDAAAPFDLAHGPLFRASLLRLADEEHMLLLNMHHSISDEWSLSILRRDLSALYAAACSGRPALLPELPVQYAAFASWERRRLQGDTLHEHAAYWRERLKDFPHTLSLPTDHPRPAVLGSDGDSYSFGLSEELTAAMDALCREAGVTRFMLLSTALNILLHVYTGQSHILLGVPSANRSRPAVADLIGFFVNTLVLPTDLSGDPSITQLLARVRQTSLEVFAHQDLPFSQVVEALQPARDLSRHPLIQVMLVLINFARDDFTLPGIQSEPLPITPIGAKFDLTLYVFEEQYDALHARLEYSTELFDETTIIRFCGHLRMVLEAVTSAPDRPLSTISLLTPPERLQLLVEWNSTSAGYPLDASIAQLFEQQVARTPTTPALLFDHNRFLSYDDLNRRANQLAHLLQERGVRPGTFIGVCLERSPEAVVSYLAILKIGAAFVPLDPDFPPERLAYMLSDARPDLVLTLLRHVPVLSAGQDFLCLDRDAVQIDQQSVANMSPVAADLLYLIYTSGSTGRPKGVLGRQRAMISRLYWTWQSFPYVPGEICCLKTSLNFVDSIAELFAPLLRGIPAAICTDEQLHDPAQLVALLAHYKVTQWILVPSLLEALLDAVPDLAQQLPHLRLWVSSGEALPLALARRFHRLMPRARLLNLYGMSEAGPDVTVYETANLRDHDLTVPIGRPLANVVTYIVDPHGNPLPIGVMGELLVGGVGLAQGYHNQPQLTADRFIPDPFSTGDVLYRTGDLARYRQDGVIEYLGRRDHQVKVRGHRIELGEIEETLLRHPHVRSAAVIAPGEDADRRLLAFVSTDVARLLQPRITAAELRRFLQALLPNFMLPTITILDALPLAPNGKVDRRALAALTTSESGPLDAYSAPQTAAERQLAAIWAGILGRPQIGRHDNFFELGGHSLLALRLMAQIQAEMGQNLPLIALFRAPTVAELAQYLTQDSSPGDWSSLEPLQPLGDRPPFFCVHGVTGDILWFTDLAALLAPYGQPFYGLQARGLDGRQPPFDTLEAMAAYYLEAIQALQSQGPYYLGGASFGGMVAYEMAQQLRSRGLRVARLVMFDYTPGDSRPQPLWQPRIALRFLQNLPHWFFDMTTLSPAQITARARRKVRLGYQAAVRDIAGSNGENTPAAGDILDYASQLPEERQRLIETHLRAIRHYTPQPYPGRITYFRAQSRPLLRPDHPESGWRELALAGLDTIIIPGSHEGIFKHPHVRRLAEHLAAQLQDTPT